MIISIASGKGGAGKTSLLGPLASLATDMVLCDADVDAADLCLILEPDIQERYAEGSEAAKAVRQIWGRVISRL
jgi:MinD superfamily P-loop ATPase